MNVCHCRSLWYTKYQIPFSKIQRCDKSKLQTAGCSCAPDTPQCSFHGLHLSSSAAPQEHLERGWRKPQSWEGPVLLQGNRGSGAWRRHSFPLPAPGARALPEFVPRSVSIGFKVHHTHITQIPSSLSFCCAAPLVFQLGICMFSYISYTGCIFKDLWSCCMQNWVKLMAILVCYLQGRGIWANSLSSTSDCFSFLCWL